MPPKTPPGAPPAPRNDHRDAFQRGTNVSSAADQLVRTATLEDDLETLRIHYEQYFLGLTRKPPTHERAALRSGILQLKSSFVRNAAVKFRVQALHNRYLSYERMWDRTLREIEDGTYRRDLFKARLHKARAESASAARRPGASEADPSGRGPDDDFDVDEEGDGAEAPAGSAAAGPGLAPPADPAASTAPGPATPAVVRPRGPGAGAGAARPVPTGAPSSATSGAPAGLDDARIRELHAAYVEARRRCNERTEGLTVEAVGAALRKQVPELLARHKARSVDFQVVIQDGKAVLKAYPR